jgi:hypothetical protein
MARSDDDKPDAKPSPGAKKKRAPTPKPAARAKKAAEGAKAPPAKRAPAVKKPRPPAARAKASAVPAAKPPRAPRKAAAPRRKAKSPAAVPEPEIVPAPAPVVAESVMAAELGDEERIEEAKYQPRERAPRAFEEERFLFPETYGENRVRLLVKDPEWLFAHWDVAPASLDGLRNDVGERTAALSRLTLRIRDPHHGGTSVILLPEGVRSWYVKADHEPRAYRAELGFTLPSGEFRALAESNTVRTPWTGSSGQRSDRRVRFDGTTPPRPAGADRAGAGVAPPSEPWQPGAAGPGPWSPDPATQIGGQPAPDAPEAAPGPAPGPGGSSDVYRR